MGDGYHNRDVSKATQPKARWLRRVVRRKLVLALAIVMAYPLAFWMMFDTSTPADKWDVDNSPSGFRVALGPRPRAAICSPRSPDGWNFDGSEWPFVVFRPLCIAWLRLHGYVPPQASGGSANIGSHQSRRVELPNNPGI